MKMGSPIKGQVLVKGKGCSITSPNGYGSQALLRRNWHFPMKRKTGFMEWDISYTEFNRIVLILNNGNDTVQLTIHLF